jgi:aspartate carbamoyltransferase catalytic subunit
MRKSSKGRPAPARAAAGPAPPAEGHRHPVRPAQHAHAPASRPRLRRLGHQSIDAYDTDRSRMGTATGESIEDHIHTVELYGDLADRALAYGGHALSRRAQSYLPVINAGNGADEHPTQALVDIFAIRQMRGPIETLSIALSSDSRARFAISFVKMLRLRRRSVSRCAACRTPRSTRRCGR